MNEARVHIDISDAVKNLTKVADTYREVGKEAERLDDIARKAMSATESGVKKANDELDEQLTLVERLEKEFKRLDKEINQATDIKDIRRLNREIKETEEALERAKKQSGDTFKKMKAETKSTENAFNKLSGAIAGAFTVAAVVAFVGKVKEIADETDKATRSVRKFFNVVGKEQTELTKQSLFLAQTTEEDITNINTAVKNLSNVYADMGLSAEDAFDLVDKAVVKGANARGELFELLKEYPTQLKKVGLSAEQSLALLTQSELSGVFSDKGLDIIKEAGERLSRFEKPAVDAMKAIGLPAEELIKQVEAGEKSVFDIMQLSAKEIDKLGTKSVTAQRAIEGIFGTQGVDAGEEYLKFLANANLNFNELNDKTTDLEKANREFTKSWIELTVAGTKSDSIFTKIYAGVLKLSAKFLSFIKQLLDYSQPVVDAFTSLKNSLVEAFAPLKRLADKFGLFNKTGAIAKAIMTDLAIKFRLILIPVKLAIRAFARITEAIEDFVSKHPKLLKVLKGTGNIFKEAFDFVLNAPAYFAGFLYAAQEAVFAVSDIFTQQFTDIGKLITSVLTFDADGIKASLNDLFDNTKNSFSEFGGRIKDAFNEGFNDNKIEFKDETEAVEKEIENKIIPNLNKDKGAGKRISGRIKEDIVTIVSKSIKEIKMPPIELPPLDLRVPDVNKTFADFWKKLKPNEDDINQIKATASDLVSLFEETAQANLDAINSKIEAKNKEISELESQLQTELQLNEQGFASNVELKQRELEEARKQAKQIEQQKREAQKAQQRIDDAMQVSNIITAISQLIKQWSALSPFGYIAGIAQVGIMLAQYGALKSKAKKLRKGATGLKEGLIEGPSHENGGVPFEVEGGEYHSITPQNQAKKYLPLLEAIRIDDTEAMREHLMKIVGLEDGLNIKMMQNISHQSMSKSPVYHSDLKAIHSTLKQSLNQESEIITNGYRIIKKGNITKRIKLK